MKKRIFSLLVTLVVAVSVILGVSIFANAAETDGLKGSAISLAENVTLKMEVAIAEPTDGAYAKITLPGGAVDATQLVAAAPKNGDNYVFFAQIAIKDLAEDVTIEILGTDGSTLVAAATTTALAYCNAYTEGEFLGLVGALKAYANAADVYFDKEATADEVATADFSAVADVAFAGTLPAGITHRSATLLLESETTIRHYFELAAGKSILAYTFFIDLDKDGKADAEEKLTASSKTTEDGKTVYYVEIADLTPNQLDEVYTVAVTDGTSTYSCDYGVATYAKRAYESGDAKAKNLAANLFAYSTEAGKLTGTITFDANGGSAVAAQTYEYGVNTPVVAVTTNATANTFFMGWADANGNIVDTIPASSTGNVALTAQWATLAPGTTSNKYYYAGAQNYNGYCPTHVDTDEPADGICNTCEYCIAVCDNAEACTKCGKATPSDVGIGIWKSYEWLNQHYYVSTTVGGKQGAIIGFKNVYGNNVPWGYFGNVGFGASATSGYNRISYSLTLAKTAEDAPVVTFYNRIRTSSKVEIGLFQMNSEGEWTILGTSTGVKLTTTPTTYVIDFDITEDKVLTAYFYVNGVLQCVISSTETADLIDNYNNDRLGQWRVHGAGSIFIADRIYPNQVNYANQIDYNLGIGAIVTLPAGAPTAYTPGVATDLPETATREGYTFEGWFADAAFTQPISAVPANAYGSYNVYAKWDKIPETTQTASYDFSGITEYVSGYCPNHTDGEDEDAFCDNCGYCITTCTSDTVAADGKHQGGKCTVCGKDLIGYTQLSLFNSKEARNNFYTDNVVKKDANGNDVAGTIYGVSNVQGSDVAFGTISGSSYATNYNNGENAVYYDFVMARAYEEGDVTKWVARFRTSDKKDLVPFIFDTTGEIIILGANSGVMLDMVARTYRIVIDITDGASQKLTGYLYVDGKLMFEVTTEIAYPITSYTYGDQLSQFRLAGAGHIWFGSIKAGTMAY